MADLLTYLNDPTLKAAFLAQLAEHERLDQFLKGTYGQMHSHFRGCGVGCSLHALNVIQGRANLLEGTGDHRRYESELGIPIWLAYLEDQLFETLPDADAWGWPRAFAEAIPVGVTIPDRLLATILRWTLASETFGLRYATDDVEAIAAIDRMAALFDRELAGHSPSEAEWTGAAKATWAAWAARVAGAAGDAWAARAARVAGAAWDERLKNGAQAASCTTALARVIVDELRALAVDRIPREFSTR